MLSRSGTEVRPVKYPAAGPGGLLPVIGHRIAGRRWQSRLRELEIRIEAKEREFARALESAAAERAGAGQAAGRKRGSCMAVASCSAQLQQALDEFRSQREEYFAQVEHEVVRLALAIAERILHREAQVDPLLLAGAVRVALGQLAESTEVRLRVPPRSGDVGGDGAADAGTAVAAGGAARRGTAGARRRSGSRAGIGGSGRKSAAGRDRTLLLRSYWSRRHGEAASRSGTAAGRRG